MAKTAAQRQSEYRARRNDGDGDRRINTWVTSTTDYALDRLAKRHGATRRQILEQLISAADTAILTSLELDTPEWDAYFAVTQ
jgi:small-conductance mechanosensitive channel